MSVISSLQVHVDPVVIPATVIVRGEALEERIVNRSTLLSDLRSTHGALDLPVSWHTFNLWRSSSDITTLDVEDLSQLLQVNAWAQHCCRTRLR